MEDKLEIEFGYSPILPKGISDERANELGELLSEAAIAVATVAGNNPATLATLVANLPAMCASAIRLLENNRGLADELVRGTILALAASEPDAEGD